MSYFEAVQVVNAIERVGYQTNWETLTIRVVLIMHGGYEVFVSAVGLHEESQVWHIVDIADLAGWIMENLPLMIGGR